jgi:hypothetical protein
VLGCETLRACQMPNRTNHGPSFCLATSCPRTSAHGVQYSNIPLGAALAWCSTTTDAHRFQPITWRRRVAFRPPLNPLPTTPLLRFTPRRLSIVSSTPKQPPSQKNLTFVNPPTRILHHIDASVDSIRSPWYVFVGDNEVARCLTELYKAYLK